MNWLGLFSGEGGMELGLERAGHNIVGFCENNPYAAKVLKTNHPNLPVFSNINWLIGKFNKIFMKKKITPDDVAVLSGTIHGLCGGFPCQKISIAGPKTGFKECKRKKLKKLKRKARAFGFNTDALLVRLNRSGSSLRMLPICSTSDLQRSSRISIPSGMMRNGKLFQREPLVPTILEKEFGLSHIENLPTPTVRDSGRPLPPRKKNKSGGQQPPLVSVIGGRINPRFVERMMGFPANWNNLEESKLP